MKSTVLFRRKRATCVNQARADWPISPDDPSESAAEYRRVANTAIIITTTVPRSVMK